ncbi:uncharacterized protein LOC118610698 [Rousettus aegyptiacus]|uniref:uncharacterized protein LOC118610698 n=1 Tax=Rousettus aegyptiacus TaxID=9407 RepID=UPI00168CB1F4|nr:uncharacterized protein LOC118610698 [Rousettus aegyptiacus]
MTPNAWLNPKLLSSTQPICCQTQTLRPPFMTAQISQMLCVPRGQTSKTPLCLTPMKFCSRMGASSCNKEGVSIGPSKYTEGDLVLGSCCPLSSGGQTSPSVSASGHCVDLEVHFQSTRNQWKGPFAVNLTTCTAVEVDGIPSWIHHSHCEGSTRVDSSRIRALKTKTQVYISITLCFFLFSSLAQALDRPQPEPEGTLITLLTTIHKVLNKTIPDIGQDFWLCLNQKTPYYVGGRNSPKLN